MAGCGRVRRDAAGPRCARRGRERGALRQRERGEAAAAGAVAIGVGSLRDAVAHVSGEMRREPTPVPPPAAMTRSAVDLADISGHETPKRALEIAAAGGPP